MKIVILDTKSLGKGLDYSRLESLGTVIYYDHTKVDELIERLQETDIAITNKNIFSKTIISQLPNLKLIGVTGTGYNNIDIKAARVYNVAVCNVSDYCTESVTQHTFAMVLQLLNRMRYYETYISTKKYIGDTDFTHFETQFFELSALTWGIVGMGHIGKKVAGIAETFGSNIIYYSTSGKNHTTKYKEVSYNQLLKQADIITIHAPLNDKTINLFDEVAFRQMKRTAIIVNVGRGGIVNEEAVVVAINENLVAGIGLDVLVDEPMSKSSQLLKIIPNERLLITPHIAWASVQARQKVIEEVSSNISNFQKGLIKNRVEQ